MRLEGVQDLLKLAIELQASTTGLSIDQVMERFRVSRSTAERRLGALREVFPEIDSRVLEEDGRRYWRLDSLRARALLRLDATELAALETAIDLLDRQGRPDQVQALRSLSAKFRTLADSERARGLETDTEALLEGEGLALRPGPRVVIKPELIEKLREGLLACLKVRLEHRSRGADRESVRIVHPYGFLLGGRHYLVAHDEQSGEVRMFSLSDMRSATLTDDYFERPPEFDLREWASQSFGIFRDPPLDVVWHFTPEMAGLAREFSFHPSERFEEQADGSLVVRFHAGGLWEMAFHLFQWRDGVEVLEPPELRDTLVGMLETTLGVYRKP
jgi:predicted DNA-binding transcriptional regulator YafY